MYCHVSNAVCLNRNMAKVVLVGVLLLQILIRQGLGDDSVHGETAYVNKNDYSDVHPVYNTPVSTVESSDVETVNSPIPIDEDSYKTTESEEQTAESNVGLDADEQIKRIQQASETISSVIQSEFDNLAKMIQNPEKRSKRETTSLPSTKYLAKFLNYIRAHNTQQNDIINKIMSAEEIAEKFGINYTPAIESNEVENDLDIQASEKAEQTTEIPVEQVADPTLETTTELPNIVYPYTTPVPHTTDEDYYYYYDTSSETTPAPLETLEDTTEQPQIYDHIYQEPIKGTSENVNPLVPQTAYEYTTPAYPEQISIPYVVPAQEQIFYMMQPQEPTVFTDEVENILETDYSTEKGEVPRVSHQTYSTMHRMSQMPGTAYYHAVPQQMQYYFSLA